MGIPLTIFNTGSEVTAPALIDLKTALVPVEGPSMIYEVPVASRAAFREIDLLGKQTSLSVGRYAGKKCEQLSVWGHNIRCLAHCANVTVKFGELGIPTFAAEPCEGFAGTLSSRLAVEWQSYIETCIGIFGANRCMFECNSRLTRRGALILFYGMRSSS